MDTGYLFEMGLLCFVYGAHFLHNITCGAFSKQAWKRPRIPWGFIGSSGFSRDREPHSEGAAAAAQT